MDPAGFILNAQRKALRCAGRRKELEENIGRIAADTVREAAVVQMVIPTQTENIEIEHL